MDDARPDRLPALNIFTCADRAYEDFAPLFIAACRWSNPYAVVEVGLEDASAFEAANPGAMEALRAASPAGSFLLRDAWPAPGPVRPASVRFVTTPVMAARNVYIGDIDIITLTPRILALHKQHMAKLRLPYSNAMRPAGGRLTGLHFSRFAAYYPLPPHEDLLQTDPVDEVLLYELVRRKLGEPPALDGYRPVHGIHVSPRRRPLPRIKNGQFIPGWEIWPHAKAWRQFRVTPAFAALKPHLSERVRGCLRQIDEVIAAGRPPR